MPEAPQPPLSELTDEQLAELMRDGSEQAFNALVNRYTRDLYHFLARFVSDPTLADDLFQETFLQVYQSIETFDASRSFRPWLFTIGANKARDYLRRVASRGKPITLSTRIGNRDDGRTLVDLMEDNLPLPPENVTNDEVQQLVRETIDSMPEHLREILLLAYFHQFAYKDIAEMLNIPLGTVKSRLHASVGTFAELWRHRFGPSA